MNETKTLQQKLIVAAGGLFMRLGIKSVSMDDIAREMGVSKKTLYTLVENKRDLIVEVVEADTREDLRVLAEFHDIATDAIDEYLRTSRYFIRQMRKISPTTMHDLQKYYPDIWKQQMEAHNQEFRNAIAANLERGMEEGLYRSDLDTAVLADLYFGSMAMIMDRSVFPAIERPLFKIIRTHSEYHLHGIVNQFGRERMDAYLKAESLE